MSGVGASSPFDGVETLDPVLLLFGFCLYGALPVAYLATHVFANKEMTVVDVAAPGLLGALLMGWSVLLVWRRVYFAPDQFCPESPASDVSESNRETAPAAGRWLLVQLPSIPGF